MPELKMLVRDLNDYYEDYNSIVFQNFNRNIQLLDSAKNLPEAKSTSISLLETKLSKLLNGNGNDIEGFTTKFKINMTQMFSYVKAFQ